MRTLSFISLCVALSVLTPAVAAAQEGGGERSSYRASGGIMDASAQTRPQMISVFAVAPWYTGFGVGAGVRYTLPIVHDGFIKPINDSVELEFGADVWYGSWYSGYYVNGYQYYYGYTGLGIPVEGRWTFHLTDRFDVYGKLGFGWALQFWNNNNPYYGSTVYSYPVFIGGTGLLFRVGDTVSLRAEIGSFGLRGGVGFAF